MLEIGWVGLAFTVHSYLSPSLCMHQHVLNACGGLSKKGIFRVSPAIERESRLFKEDILIQSQEADQAEGGPTW